MSDLKDKKLYIAATTLQTVFASGAKENTLLLEEGHGFLCQEWEINNKPGLLKHTSIGEIDSINDIPDGWEDNDIFIYGTDGIDISAREFFFKQAGLEKDYTEYLRLKNIFENFE